MTTSRGGLQWRRNKLGVRGVWITKSGKYVAGIRVAGKKRYLGLFDTVEEASVAYTRAAKDALGNSRERGDALPAAFIRHSQKRRFAVH